MNNWQDTTREKMRSFIGCLFGISISKIVEISNIWSSDWVVGSPAIAKLFYTRQILGLVVRCPFGRERKSTSKSGPL